MLERYRRNTYNRFIVKDPGKAGHPRKRSPAARTSALVAAGLWALAAVVACSDKSLPKDFPNEPGGNPLVPEVALLPFPSDFYLVADGTTPTGRRVSIPQAALHERVPAHIFSDADGFTMAPALLAWLPGGFDLSSLPDRLDPGATLESGSSVFLVKGGSWEKWPALVELDQSQEDPKKRFLIVRPHRKLDPNTGYVVIIRNKLKRLDGSAHQAGEAFRMLRDNVPTADPAIEKQRDAFKLVNEAIARLGLKPEEVVLAWSFHTRSEEGVVSTFVDMQRRTWEEAAGSYTIVSNEVVGENRIIEATFEAPNWRDADGLVQVDSQGKAILQGRVTVPFRVTIPTAVDETRPVILYGHGFLGHYDQSSRGPVNQLCRERRYSAVATDLGFNRDDTPEIFSILATRLEDIRWIVSLNWQNMCNFTALAKLTRDKLSQDLMEDRGGGSFRPLDANNIHYSGISNGGTFGYVVAATSPALRRAVLIVGGGGLTHFLQRAVNWRDFEWIFRMLYSDPNDIQLLLSLMQGPLDSIDSINYAHRITSNRFAGLQPMKAAIHMALNDSQVRNVLTEWVARTWNIPLVTPTAKEIWGLTPITATMPGRTDIDSAMFVYDEKVEPSPTTNVPPETDNGTHQTVGRLSTMQESWYQLIEHGRFLQVCEGPCDPL